MSKSSVPLLYIAITIIALQCLAIMGFIVWMLKNPVDESHGDTQRAISSMLGSGSSGAISDGQTSGGPAGTNPGIGAIREKTVPTFDTETEAVQDYLSRLTAAFDLDLVLSGQYTLSSIQRTHDMAAACTGFDCPAMDDLRVILLLTGRRVPPEPRWKGATSYNHQKNLIIDYLGVIASDMTELATQEERPDLQPDTALLRKAVGCASLDCPDLDAFIEASGIQLATVGRSVPPKPTGLAASGPGDGHAGGAAHAGAPGAGGPAAH